MDRPEGFIDLEFRMRRALLILVWLAIVGLLAVGLFYAQPFISQVLTVLSPFIVALIVAYVFNPIVNLLQRKFGLGRIWGVVITYGIILGITAGFFALLVPILYGQLREGITNLINNFPEMLDKATAWLKLRVSAEELAQAREFMRQNFDIGALTGRAGDAVGQAVDTTRLLTQAIGTTLSIIIGGVAFIAFIIVICFYFLLDYHRLEHIARVLLPEDKESRVFMIWAKIDEALGGYLRGQLIVACTVGVIYMVALWLLGMKEYAILIGFMAGMGNMVPYLGPVIGGVPTALWVLFGTEYEGSEAKLIGVGLVVLLTIGVQTLDGLFFQPRIVGQNAELHPLLVLLALLIGAQFGLGGLIIAVPVAIMARVVLKELWWDPLERQEYVNKHPSVAIAGGAVAMGARSEVIKPEAVAVPDVALSTVEEPEAPGERAQAEGRKGDKPRRSGGRRRRK